MQLSHLTICCMCVLSNICRCGCMQGGETEESNVGKCIITRVCVVADFGATAKCAEKIHTAGNVSFITLQLSLKNCFLFWRQSPHTVGWFINTPLLQWIAKCWNKKLCRVRMRDGSRHVQVGVVIEVEGHTASILPAACSITIVPKTGNFSRQSRNISDLDCSLDGTNSHNSTSADFDTSTVRWKLPPAFHDQLHKHATRKRNRKKRDGFLYADRNTAYADDTLDYPLPRDYSKKESLKDIFFSDASDDSDTYTGQLTPDEKIWDADLSESVDPVMTFPDDVMNRVDITRNKKLPMETPRKSGEAQIITSRPVLNRTQTSKEFRVDTEGKDMLHALEENIEGRLESSLEDLMQEKEQERKQEMALVSSLAMESKVDEALASVEKEPKLGGPALETPRGFARPPPEPPMSDMFQPEVEKTAHRHKHPKRPKHPQPGAANTAMPKHPVMARPIPPPQHVMSSIDKPWVPPRISKKKKTNTTFTATTTTTTTSTTSTSTTSTTASTPTTVTSGTNASTTLAPHGQNLTLSSEEINLKEEDAPTPPPRTVGEAATSPETTMENILRAEMILKVSINRLKKKIARILNVRSHPYRKKMLKRLNYGVEVSSHKAAWAMVRQVCHESLKPMQKVGTGWQPWSEWSECSVSCGFSGFHIRRRICRAEESCTGPNFDLKSCGLQSKCQGSATWLVWSQWSECSAGCGKDGQKARSRSCLTDDSDVRCMGESFELMACVSAACSAQQGESNGPTPSVGPEPIKTASITTPGPASTTSIQPAGKKISSGSFPRGRKHKNRKRKKKKRKKKKKKKHGKRKRKKEKKRKHTRRKEKREWSRRKWPHSRSADSELESLLDLDDSAMVEMQGLNDFSATKQQQQVDKKEELSDTDVEQFQPLETEAKMTSPKLFGLLQHAAPEPAKISSGNISWTTWGVWSGCSVTCGKGTQFRKRECMKQIGQTFEGEPLKSNFCSGADKDKKYCSEGLCPLSVAIPKKVMGIETGGNASATCRHSYQGQVAGVYWVTPDGTHITTETQNDKYQLHNLTLIIRHAHLSDLGQYTCVLIGPKQLQGLPEENHFKPTAPQRVLQTCAENPCENGGTCEPTPGVYMDLYFQYRCECLVGYYGQHCEQKFLIHGTLNYLKIIGIALGGIMASLVFASAVVCLYYRIENEKPDESTDHPVLIRRRSEDEWRKMKTYDQKGETGPSRKKKVSLTKRLSQMFRGKTDDDIEDEKRKFGMEDVEESPDPNTTPSASADQKSNGKNKSTNKSVVNSGYSVKEIPEEEFAKFNDERLTANLDQPSQLELEVKQLLEDASHNASPPPDGTRENGGSYSDSHLRRWRSDSPPPTLQVNPTMIYSDDAMEFVSHDDSQHQLWDREENNSGQDGKRISSSNQPPFGEREARSKTSSHRTKRKRCPKEKSGWSIHADKCQYNQNYTDESTGEGSSSDQVADTGHQRRAYSSQVASPETKQNYLSHQNYSSIGSTQASHQSTSGCGTSSQSKLRNSSSHQLTNCGSHLNISTQAAMQPVWQNAHSPECQLMEQNSATRPSLSRGYCSSAKSPEDHFQFLLKHYEVHHPDEPYPYRQSRSRRNTTEARGGASTSTSWRASPHQTERPANSADRNLRRSCNSETATYAESSQGTGTSFSDHHCYQRPCCPGSVRQKHLEGGGEGAAAADAAMRSDSHKSGRDVLLRKAMENCFIQASKARDSRPDLLHGAGSRDQLQASSRQISSSFSGHHQSRRSSTSSGNESPPSLVHAGKSLPATVAPDISREDIEARQKESTAAQKQVTCSESRPWSEPFEQFSSPQSRRDSIKVARSSASTSATNFPKSQLLTQQSNLSEPQFGQDCSRASSQEQVTLASSESISSLGWVTEDHRKYSNIRRDREPSIRRQPPAVFPKQEVTPLQVFTPCSSHANLAGNASTSQTIPPSDQSSAYWQDVTTTYVLEIQKQDPGTASAQEVDQTHLSEGCNGGSVSAKLTHQGTTPGDPAGTGSGSVSDSSQPSSANKGDRPGTSGECSSVASRLPPRPDQPYLFTQTSSISQLKPEGLKSALKHQSSVQSLGSPAEVERVRNPRRVSFSEPKVHHSKVDGNREDFPWFISTTAAAVGTREDGASATTSRQFDAISQREGGPLSVERQFESIGRRPFGPLDLDAFFSTLPKAAPSAASSLVENEKDTSGRNNVETSGDSTKERNSQQKSATVQQTKSLFTGCAASENFEAESQEMGSVQTRDSCAYFGAQITHSALNVRLPSDDSESSPPPSWKVEAGNNANARLSGKTSAVVESPLLIDIENSCSGSSSECCVQKTGEEILRQNAHTQLTPDPTADRDKPRKTFEQSNSDMASASAWSPQHGPSLLSAECDNAATAINADVSQRQTIATEEAGERETSSLPEESRLSDISFLPVPVPFESFQNLISMRAPSAFFKPILRPSRKSPKSASSSESV